LLYKNKQEFKSLNNRIQFILVTIIVLSLAGVVIGTIWVVTTQSEIKNKNELLLKSKSVFNELQQSVGQQNILESSYKEYTTFTLKKLSKIFGSDVSLFDNNGYLFATSQPAIYDQGLVSKFMDPNAFSGFLQNKTVNFSHRETIGKLNYLSTYIPFYNSNNKLLGYLNLPYFSRQKDLEKELSVYLTTLLNIYTILFIITTLVALLISNLVTKPLRIIKQQISDTKFEKNIKPIIWNSNDEIGNLVNEYNSMLIKLKKNSELLAQSERESAWLEMSKQVAHEIKNPLTPMKLNIQHLQRVVKSNPENISEKVDKVAEMLIQQIDTLSHIATEFSNFSKFPSTKIEKVDLVELLQNATNLFNESSNCLIECETENNLFVSVDKEQCIRVLTNLIKNAEQSIPEDRIGRINIQAHKISDTIEIKISDNGYGIPLEYYGQIFTPKFTTKNSGTGLGLAMVKNSITAFNGTINFKSELGVGTTFTILLPVIN
jgi:signal transduction histidine kinase